jgi:nuclear cap-binding protein subunit 1
MTTDLAIQSLLQIGSKSFSHFLNMLERYVTVLRDVTSTAARRQKLLSSIASFCGSNYHFITIVIDKLVRYQILDPIDVVRWIIATEAAFLSLNQWEILVNTLDLLTTRVNGISARLEADKAENAAGELTLIEAFVLTLAQLKKQPRSIPQRLKTRSIPQRLKHSWLH